MTALPLWVKPKRRHRAVQNQNLTISRRKKKLFYVHLSNAILNFKNILNFVNFTEF